MQKFFKAMDGMLYMDVSSKAFKIFDANIFDLFILWEKGERTFKIPLMERDEIQVAFDFGKSVCIEVCPTCSCGVDKWSDADKIIHNGFVYVRYSDIKP